MVTYKIDGQRVPTLDAEQMKRRNRARYAWYTLTAIALVSAFCSWACPACSASLNEHQAEFDRERETSVINTIEACRSSCSELGCTSHFRLGAVYSSDVGCACECPPE